MHQLHRHLSHFITSSVVYGPHYQTTALFAGALRSGPVTAASRLAYFTLDIEAMYRDFAQNPPMLNFFDILKIPLTFEVVFFQDIQLALAPYTIDDQASQPPTKKALGDECSTYPHVMVPCMKPFLPNDWKGKPLKGNFEAVKSYLDHCRSTYLAPYGVTHIGPLRGRHMGHLLLTLESVEQANTFIQLWNLPDHLLPLKTFIDLTTNASTHVYAVLAPPELPTFLPLEQAPRLMDQVYPLGLRPRTKGLNKPPGSPMNSRKRLSPSPASSPQARWAREDRN